MTSDPGERLGGLLGSDLTDPTLAHALRRVDLHQRAGDGRAGGHGGGQGRNLTGEITATTGGHR